jgi:hypothetical protein
MQAISQYVTTVQERSQYFMAAKRLGGGPHALQYSILYDNSWEHFEIQESDLPVNGKTTSMIKWIHKLQGIAEQKFQISLGDRPPS